MSVKLLKQTETGIQTAVLDDALFSDDPGIRTGGRFHATGAVDLINNWIKAEIERDPSPEHVTRIIETLTATHMQMIASIAVALNFGETSPELARIMTGMQQGAADRIIGKHMAIVAANRSEASP